jgi:prefoldin subunit 5
MAEIDFSDLHSYLVSLAKRIAKMEVRAEELGAEISETNDTVRGHHRLYRERVRSLRAEVKSIRQDVSELGTVIEQMINRFKHTARSNSLQRLERKIDRWDFENLVTRSELAKLRDQVQQ